MINRYGSFRLSWDAASSSQNQKQPWFTAIEAKCEALVWLQFSAAWVSSAGQFVAWALFFEDYVFESRSNSGQGDASRGGEGAEGRGGGNV